MASVALQHRGHSSAGQKPGSDFVSLGIVVWLPCPFQTNMCMAFSSLLYQLALAFSATGPPSAGRHCLTVVLLIFLRCVSLPSGVSCLPSPHSRTHRRPRVPRPSSPRLVTGLQRAGVLSYMTYSPRLGLASGCCLWEQNFSS